MHQDVIDKKLIVGEHKIKDISMGAKITSFFFVKGCGMMKN